LNTFANHAEAIIKITDIINKWDPLGLFVVGRRLVSSSAVHEYDIEIGHLLETIKRSDNPQIIADKIYRVFTESFSADVFTSPFIECVSVALEIKKSVPDFCGCQKYDV
jgi:hypothetical protein